MHKARPQTPDPTRTRTSFSLTYLSICSLDKCIAYSCTYLSTFLFHIHMHLCLYPGASQKARSGRRPPCTGPGADQRKAWRTSWAWLLRCPGVCSMRLHVDIVQHTGTYAWYTYMNICVYTHMCIYIYHIHIHVYVHVCMYRYDKANWGDRCKYWGACSCAQASTYTHIGVDFHISCI